MSLRVALSPLLCLALVTGCGGELPPPATPPPAPPFSAATPPPAPTAPAAPVASAPAADASLGQLDFAVTGNAESQKMFREGMLALHSFLYDQAAESFIAARTADPSCAMASWGEAMTYEHPIWHERDLKKARAALAHVTAEDGLTPKERAYLATARALYAKDDAKDAHKDWLAAAAAMHADFADDDEVALQHALALLSVYGYDEKHVREQMEAGAIALAVLARRPEHPGAAHYVIHAMDTREHAILALPAARTYARIAPAASHALHMPSHTFVHLGMWRDVVPSNEKAYAASVAWEKSRGHAPAKYDWHSYSWLVAAHLELGQPAAARKLIDEARALVVATTEDAGEIRAPYIDMVAAYATNTDRWGDVEALVAPVFAIIPGEGTGGDGPVACAAHAPGGGGSVRLPGVLLARVNANELRAEAAIHAGDRATAEKRVSDIKAVRAQMAAWAKSLRPDYFKRMEVRDAALLERARVAKGAPPGAWKRSVDALVKFEALQKGLANAGPAWLKSVQETLAEALLASGKPKEALAEWEVDVDARPNHAIALLGAARAAKAAGDDAKAHARYAELADLWRDADADLPALAEVKAGAK
jgi:hypothetical protein